MSSREIPAPGVRLGVGSGSHGVQTARMLEGIEALLLERKPDVVVVYGDKESDESLAIREHGGEQTTLSLAEFRAKVATLEIWKAGAEPSLTS